MAKQITTRKDAIKEKCLDCMCGQQNEVKLCPSEDCALWPFRLGKDPFRKAMSEEQRAKLSMLGKARAEKGALFVRNTEENPDDGDS